MTNDISNRIEELKLLGWSEEGVQFYSKQLLNQNIHKELISNQEILILFIIIFVGIITTISLVLKRASKAQKSKFSIKPNKLETTSLNKESSIIKVVKPTNIKSRTKANFLDFVMKEFKSTAINPGKIIEHFLLIIILSYEFIRRFIHELYKDYFIIKQEKSKMNSNQKEEEEFLINNELITIEIKERKMQLRGKTNLELKNYLKGVPYISKMKKEDLITQIIFLEFNQ